MAAARRACDHLAAESRQLRDGWALTDTTLMKRLINRITGLALFLSLGFALSFEGQSAKKETKKQNLEGLFSLGSFQVKYVRFAGQPVPSKDFRVLLDHQAKWDDAGASNSNGSHLRFVMIQNQSAQAEHGPTRYRVFAEGAPQNKVYSLQTWLVNNEATTVDRRDLYVNTQGLVMTRRPRADEESSLSVGEDELQVESGASVAEPMRYLLSAVDGEFLVYGTLVAHPLQSNDQGCRLEARIAQPNETAILIIADGFPAKSKIPLVLRSGDALASDTLETDSNGHAVWAVSPIVPGVTQGILKASAEGPNCLPSVVLPWRTGSNDAPKSPEH